MAAQVAHFRSESTSPIAPISTTQKGRHQNSMAATGPPATNGATNASSSNNFDGITALMVACQQGRSEDVQTILRKKKTAVKDRTRSGKVSLHFCAESGSTSCLEQILAAETFLINAQDEEGYTPLHLAVINGNKDIVRKLIAAGADLNCLDKECHSLVHWATVCGEVDILEILLSNGAPASTPDIHLAHPIHYASQMCGSVNGVGSMSRARVQSTVYGVSPKKGLQILKRLVQFGCPIDVRDQDGRQPLLWAASAGSGDAILLLVNAGAKVDAEDKDGLTALHCAASRGHTDCLETLIALCGAEVDVIDNNGCTALFYAVTLGHADCTELLLNYGSEPNRQDRKGRTPAHCGAAKGQLETLKLLARHGGNLWLRNVRGDLALHEAVLSRRKDLVMWLLSLRPDAVNTSNNDGRCPIHLAALNNNVEMVKILIDHRADINVLMRSGKGTAMTPLDAGIMKGNSAVAKFLQLHGGLPSNSLNDAALHRRLNRSSVEGQISPAGSMRGSNLGSHHHPSPEDQQMNFTSPEVFDSSLIHYSRNSQNHNSYDKRGPQANSPFIATSTPIMDDGVQTDPHYFRDMEVQTMQVEKVEDKQQVSMQREKSHRKSDRRRRRRSHQDEQDSSSESSPDRSSNQLTSRASRKSSRRSRKGSVTSGSKSHSHSSSRNSEEKAKKGQSENISVEKDDETDSTTHSRDKKKRLTPQGSSDTLLDNTLISEKFSELENVAVQSSETDARDEELGPPDMIEKSVDKKEKVKHKVKDTSKSKDKSDKETEEKTGRRSESEEDKSKTSKSKSKTNIDEPHPQSRSSRSPENKTTRSKSKSKSKSRDLTPERTSKERKTPETSKPRSKSKSKSKSRELTPERTSKDGESPESITTPKSKSRDSTPEGISKKSERPAPHDRPKSKSKERSLSAKSVHRSVSAEREKVSRSRSASASGSRSVSRNKSVDVPDSIDKPSKVKDNSESNESKSNDHENRTASARKSRSRSPSQKRTSSRKNSNLKSRTPSGKTGSVSWRDEADGKSQEKLSSDERETIQTKSKSKERETGTKPRRSNSPSSEQQQQSETDSKSNNTKPESNDEGRRSRNSSAKKKAPTKVSAKSRSRARSMEFREKDTVNSVSESEDLEVEIPDEIEAGKTINLREAARLRSESISRDPSRSRSQSISKSPQKKKPSGVAKLKPIKNRKVSSKSEEREIQLQEALLASRKNLRPKVSTITKSKGPALGSSKSTANSRPSQIPMPRRPSDENDMVSHSTVPDSGFSDPLGLTTSASEDHNNRLYSEGKSHVSMKRKVVSRRPVSGSARRSTIFSSIPKQYRAPRNDRKRFDTLIVGQLNVEHGPDGDDTNSTSTRDGSVTSEYAAEGTGSPRRRRVNLSRPRSRLTFSRGEDIRDARLSPRPRKNMDVDTPISVTQAMQASMRKYNLERTVFQELLELKRLQIRTGKTNEQMLVKRLAENYKKAGYSVNFRDYDGPFTFRGFEKFLYDQLRVLQSNRRLLPRFAPSDDLEKLSLALKKMNSTKLPFLEEAERSESTTCDSQCAHSTHRCHHAAHAYTGVPCAAYIGNRKNGFLPKVNPLKAPGPTQKELGSRNIVTNGSRNGMNGLNGMNLSSPMQISISPRTDTQSPITLEVQQGSNTQVFTLPTKALDPTKNYYVSLSIKPNPTSPRSSPVPSMSDHLDNRPSPAGDIVDDGSISAPPPPLQPNDSDVQIDLDRDKHNRSM